MPGPWEVVEMPRRRPNLFVRCIAAAITLVIAVIRIAIAFAICAAIFVLFVEGVAFLLRSTGNA